MKQANVYMILCAGFLGILIGVLLGAQLRVISIYLPLAVWAAALLCAVWAGVQAWREGER